jgi:succinate dehydrogenase / fumarate reductase cytochrome b subunit
MGQGGLDMLSANPLREGLMGPAFRMVEKVFFMSTNVRSLGWPYVLSWAHRLSGICVTAYVLFHIYTLSFLKDPSSFDDKMGMFRLWVFSFLEWLLAVPVIFHALNGVRIILYEVFGQRNETAMIRWVLCLSFLYMTILAVLMIMGNQNATPVFFWSVTVAGSLCVGYLVSLRTWRTAASVTWKLQRISAAFLLAMVAGHFLFMHLHPSIGHESETVIRRMQNPFIKMVDAAFVLAILYHGGYGILSILKDYLSSKVLRGAFLLLITVIMCLFAWIGLRLTLFV